MSVPVQSLEQSWLSRPTVCVMLPYGTGAGTMFLSTVARPAFTTTRVLNSWMPCGHGRLAGEAAQLVAPVMAPRDFPPTIEGL